MPACKDSFLHLIKSEIEEFYKVIIPDNNEEGQCVYILSSCFSVIYKKKLFVYFLSGEVIGYKICYFIFYKRIL